MLARDTQPLGEAYKLRLVFIFAQFVLFGVILLKILSAAFMMRFLHGLPVFFCAATDMLK